MLFGLSHHKLDRNPLAHTGKSEKLAEAGWWGWTVAGNSGFEYRAVFDFSQKFGEDVWVSAPQRFPTTVDLRCLSESLSTMDFMESEFSIWGRTEEIVKEIVAFLESLPQRTAEIVVISTAQMKRASAVFRGLNYRAVSLTQEDDYDPPPEYRWAITIEGTVEDAESRLLSVSEFTP